MSRRVVVPRILKSSGTWEDFKSALRLLDAKAKGDCFEALVEHYLRLSPIYKSILKHVWPLRVVPPAVRKRLNLPGPDEGIDLVAETVEGDSGRSSASTRRTRITHSPVAS